MKQFTAFLIFLMGSFAAKADLLSCTQMWCQEGVTVNLHGAQWTDGDYTFTVKADEKNVTCKSRLPYANCDGAVTCDGEGITIGESGCALPQDQHGFSSVIVNKADVKNSTIDITRGDGKKFSYSSPVEAQCSFPNGEECDHQQCCSAVLDAEIVWH